MEESWRFFGRFFYGIEDYDFWLSLIELGRKVYQIPETLFFYRIRNNSRNTQFSQNKAERQIQTIELIMYRHKTLYAENIDILIEMYLNDRKKILKIKKKLGFIG
ncbi:MAG: hypothetical protein MJ032_04045, partial [Acidaminococcaceae bacterium]|nr:hypothetical protein [Acidaminococcaceae bacterium]